MWSDQGAASDVTRAAAETTASIRTAYATGIRAASDAAYDDYANAADAVRAADAAIRATGADAAIRAAAAAAGAASAAYAAAAVALSADVECLMRDASAESLMRRPLWTAGTPAQARSGWEEIKLTLLALDQDWQVWTDWYSDRLTGTESLTGRALIPELERERVLVPDEDWEKGPAWVNGIIASLEAEYRAQVPVQRSAIVEVEYRKDGRLHRRESGPPAARDEAQEQRLRAAWAAHSDLLASLEALDPGRNTPALGRALNAYRLALGSLFEDLNVIALGVHGERLRAFAERADALLMEDAVSELAAIAAAHGLFIRQFPIWLDYAEDARGEPSEEVVEAAVQVARAAGGAREIIAEDVSEPLSALADMAREPLVADPDHPVPPVAERDLLRSVGNVLSGLMAPLVDYIRDAGKAGRKGSLSGVEDFAKKATLALAFGGTAGVAALAAGLPGEFAWIIPVLTLLKTKLEK